MSVAAVPAASVDLQRSPRALSRRRAIRWFRWSILGPLIVLLAVVLMPVLLLQLYFSFHQWSVYLGTWSDAEYVGLDLFRRGVDRSALRLGGRALPGIRHRLHARLLPGRDSRSPT